MPKYALVMDVPDEVEPEQLRTAVLELLTDRLGEYEIDPDVVMGGDVEEEVLASLSVAEQ